MAEIVNLRQARKARTRAGREAEAAANRAAHGRTKAERDLSEAREALERDRVEGHRLTDQDETKRRSRPRLPSPGCERGGASIVKRSLMVAGHRTSVSLEAPFWEGLRAAAARRSLSVQALVQEIDAGRGEQNLSSAIRVFVLTAAREERA